MKRRNKFREGAVVTSMDDLIRHARGGGWFYIWRSAYKPWGKNGLEPITNKTAWYRRPLHPGWVLSLQTNFLAWYVDKGLINLAVPNTEEGNDNDR